MNRRFPVGAEYFPENGVHFRVWAPKRGSVDVVPEGAGDAFALRKEEGGYFSGLFAGGRPGMRYKFRLDGGDSFPDPASRFQPDGPHGPSEVIEPSGFHWTDQAWRGPELTGLVVSEIHIGTFTREGTWNAARRELFELADAGINAVEVMPVADFPGRFNWGYDGVGLFAPVAVYGKPGDFRTFVDDAHAHGIAVILDVVYNHLGPDGNYLAQYSADYFTERYDNEWGSAINYDGPGSESVREFVAMNAAYWAREYHLDGLRLDATQQMFDSSPVHILQVLTEQMRSAAGKRTVLVIAENETQQAIVALPPKDRGYGLDAIWNDDFHHSARVAVTGRNEAYYSDYRGTPQELVSAVRHGFLYQGQRSSWQGKRRGTPAAELSPPQFVSFIDNHDQIANSGRGQRLHELTSPGRFRAMTTLLLLGPWTPLLFQGQEFGASSPFYFFADHTGKLRDLTRRGRYQFLAQFPSLAAPEMLPYHPDPSDPATFERSKLDFRERETHETVYRLHKDLLRMRRREPVFRAQRPGGVDGAVLGAEALVLRYFGEHDAGRLLLLNLGPDLVVEPPSEPLLAPPEGGVWTVQWSSEDPVYGGGGNETVDSGSPWRVPAHSALVLRPSEEKPQWRI
jgi:maltooligosyltrehalose trehalohydrolase